jgi:DNA topoisomerase III
MPRLILCEKPSVARAVAIGLGVPMSGGLPYRDDDWIIAAARGHLLEGAEPEEYDPSLAQWTLDSLPILPDPFRWKPRGDGELLGRLIGLFHDPTVTGVINACDAGREGELIFKLIYRHATQGAKARDPHEIPVERAWFSSLTPGAVRRAFEELRLDEAVKGLEHAAILRDTGDWMVGINATRAATLVARHDCEPDEKGPVVSVGRVQTPTLRVLVEREREIDQYLPIPFYRIRGVVGEGIPVAVVTARSAHTSPAGAGPMPSSSGAEGPRPFRVFEHRQDAEIAAAALAAADAVFAFHQVEVVERPAPLPFDLATLQVEASRAFGWTADRTLRQAQILYEKQYLSYPRTDSRFLTWDLKGQVLDAFATAVQLLPDLEAVVEGLLAQAEAGELSGRPFNPGRVRDHHAIIPTGKRLPEEHGLGDDALRLFGLVARRTVAAFLAPFRTEEHRVGATAPLPEGGPAGGLAGVLELEARARRVLESGWRVAEGGPAPVPQDSYLAAVEAMASLDPGTSLGSVAAIEVEERNPWRPRAHTDGTLIRAMERAGDPASEEPGPNPKADDDPAEDAEDGGEPHVGIGTPATRASIIETLLRRRYAVRDGTAIHATARGVRLIDALEGMDVANARLTAAWEHRLGAVERGEEDPVSFDTDLRALTRRTVEEIGSRTENLARLDGDPREVGPCPWCSGMIVERDKAYGCDSWQGAEAPGCGWVVFRNTRYGRIGMAEAGWRREHDKSTVKAGKVAFAPGDVEAIPNIGVEGYTPYQHPKPQGGVEDSQSGKGMTEQTVEPLTEGETPEEVAAWDDGILAVVQAEGPVMVRRILAALEDRAKAGGMKGKAPRKAVNRRTAALVGSGELLEVWDARDPEGQLDKVLRLPDQPDVLVRARGPRDVLEIPRRELVELLRVLDHGQGADSDAINAVLDLPEVVHEERRQWIDAAASMAKGEE